MLPGGPTPRSVTPFPISNCQPKASRHLSDVQAHQRYRPAVPRREGTTLGTSPAHQQDGSCDQGLQGRHPLFDRDEPVQLAQGTDHVYTTGEQSNNVKYNIDLLGKPKYDGGALPLVGWRWDRHSGVRRRT